jgi:hypothetical protein
MSAKEPSVIFPVQWTITQSSDGIFQIVSRNLILLILPNILIPKTGGKLHGSVIVTFKKLFMYDLYSVTHQYLKKFHMVSGTTSGLVGTKYI